ncbi:MAG TPA: OmpA family protein [Ensifer sp.]|jgi:photosystem I P700 chlorophyll a apoprotein A2|uniref:OmpA family protein n=1 Tax=Ensifer sp. TaxID=1872086 RepID=UPI002E12F38A|nr:OmpA family protein [Ensifer sp.]
MNGSPIGWRCLVRCTALAAGLLLPAFAAMGQSRASPTFRSSEIVFRSSPLSFPAGTIAFPSAPLQTETPTAIEITLPADVLFDFDKAELRTDALDALRELTAIIRAKARGPVTIQGYTDALGADAYNQKLSERRAHAVKTWLVSREGVAAKALTAPGFGARNPVAPNRKPDGSDDPDGRQLNRRVTVVIRK